VDRHIVGPLLEHLQERGGEWRMLVLPDHPTPCPRRTHTADAVPFAMAGTGVPAVVERPFTEAAAAQTDLTIDCGWELMEFFLTVR
jgi:2,3-bisphosphoglycerate-independent phosphoglycerate mutase